MKWPHRKCFWCNFLLGFLCWPLLMMLTFNFLPAWLAASISAVAFVFVMLPLPNRQEQQDDIKQEIEESRQTWRKMNR